jgi:two-component system, OmpR family, sensor kinase
MKSIRGRLTLYSWVLIAVMGLAAAVNVYVETTHEARELLESELEDLEDQLQDEIERGQNAPEAQALIGRIAHIRQQRPVNEVALDSALASLVPIGILIPLLGIAIAWAIRRLLQPVDAATHEIARRSADDLTPVNAESLPREIQPLIEEINRLLVRLQAAMERERQFITDAAHGLRTPLTALQLQADVLADAPDAEQRRRRLEQLRAGIKHAASFAAQLLMLARHESMRAKPSTQSAEVDDVIRQAVDNVAAAADRRSVQLVSQSNQGLQMRGDAPDLVLALTNLLDNAIRYSPADGVVAVETAGVGGSVQIQVRDDGPGIPPSEIDRVFERFYRAQDDATEGSGLGLAIVRAIVMRAGGAVRLANRTDRSGLIATIELPRAS